MPRRGEVRWIALLWLCWSALGAGTAALPADLAGAASASSGDWTVYHGDPTGSGLSASSNMDTVSTTKAAWTSPALDGALYGEPLALGNRVYVATENDTVYALNAATGRVDWSTHVGTPVPADHLPCGNISPIVGITGTPVIDPTRSEIFVVADELINEHPAHVLVGLHTDNGRVELNQDVDPSGATPAAELQRTGLTLDQSHVVFGIGGNYGDCSTYHGRVIAVPEAGGLPAEFVVDSGPGQSQGAVWMGGAAPVVDSGGDVLVSSGNGSVTSPGHPYDHSDAVLDLSPAMALHQFFAPTSWALDNRNDADFSTAPALLVDGQVVIAGKSRVVYLLNGSTLGGIGHQQASVPDACGQDIDGGMAVVGMTVYLPCQSGIVAVAASASPPALHIAWRSPVGGSPPIVAGGLVWTISLDGRLAGLDPSTGAVRQQVAIGRPTNHFPTPSAGAGLLLVPTDTHVVAFHIRARGSSTTTSAASSTGTTAAHHAPGVNDAHLNDNAGLVVGVVGGVLVLAGSVALVLRRRLGRRQANP